MFINKYQGQTMKVASTWKSPASLKDNCLLDDADWYFMATFVHNGRLNGPSDIQIIEMKSKMKHPSDMPMLRFELGC